MTAAKAASKSTNGISFHADVTERRAVDRLKPHKRNSKRHSEADIDEMVAAIREWGWTIPCLVDEHDNILAGEKRWRAAKRIGIAEITVIVPRGWSDAKKRAYIIADNKLNDRGQIDATMLAIEVEELEGKFNLRLAGLTDKDLSKIRGQEDDADDALLAQEIKTGVVKDEFWIGIRGPLKYQAAVLQRMRDATKDMVDVDVEIGTIGVD
jgi:hypothetical protein